ncbi:toxin-antitoxin system HicB family antitoxin [Bartonella sp. DGB2]|uniref:toxin-antitoxin system HicB family antitoxin n=1 Tax=Bartonella sp. DGB2 TaxID=3388426 RepID=UPI0039900E76
MNIGLCAEFPSLSWCATSAEEALLGIMKLVGEVLQDMHEQEEEVPTPFSLQSFSGKFQLRIPPELHRSLAIQAAV